MKIRSIEGLLVFLAACGAPSNKPRAPSVATRSTTSLAAIGAHDAFCAAPREGCTRTCLPTAWASTTPTFTHAELWAYEDHCPDAAIQQVRCTLAVERTGVWYEAFDTVCKSDASPATTTSLEIDRVSSHGGIDAFEYTVAGTLLASDEGANGERVYSTLQTSRRFIAVCGVGASRGPSCLEPIYIGGTTMGDPYAERSWTLDDGGVISLGAFPEGQVPDVSDDDGSASTFRVDMR